VLALACAHPAALSVPDPATGFYPVVQWAAQMQQQRPTDNSSTTCNADDDDNLDVLYRLLHTQPSVVCVASAGM